MIPLVMIQWSASSLASDASLAQMSDPQSWLTTTHFLSSCKNCFLTPIMNSDIASSISYGP